MFWLLAPAVLIALFLLGDGEAGPRPGLAPAEPPLPARPLRSALASRLAPPTRVQTLPLPNGWTLRWLPSIESVRAHAHQIGHSLHVFMEPVLLAGAPQFAYRIEDASGTARGSFLLSWLPEHRRYGIFQAQGPEDSLLDPEAAQAVLTFFSTLQPPGETAWTP